MDSSAYPPEEVIKNIPAQVWSRRGSRPKQKSSRISADSQSRKKNNRTGKILIVDRCAPNAKELEPH
jgi:hypothetical protein